MKINELFKNDEKILNQVKEVLGDKFEAFEKLTENNDNLSVVPYSRFKDINDSKNDKDTIIKDLNKQLEKLGKTNLTQEQFDIEKNKIMADAQIKITESETKYNDLRKSTYVKEALTTAKAKHEDLLSSKIDMSKIVEKDGKFEGIDDQIKTLKESYSDLFEQEQSNNQTNNLFNPNNLNDGIRNQTLNTNNDAISYMDALCGISNPPK